MLMVATEIITVYRFSDVHSSSKLLKDLHKLSCPPLREKVNAATILWQFTDLCEPCALTSMLPLILTDIESMESVGINHIGIHHMAEHSGPHEGFSNRS